MQHGMGSFAVRSVSWAAIGVYYCICGSTDADVGIVERDGAGRGGCHVDFEYGGSLQNISDREEHVGEFSYTDVSWTADLHDRLRVIWVVKVGADA